MQDDEKKKEPIEMTTEEAIDYLFAPQIAEKLRREVQDAEPEDSEPEQEC